MSKKYSIASYVNNKLKDEENDNKELKTANDNKTNNNNNDIKNKSLDDVLLDLKDIETKYSTKDYIDAPSELELSKIEVPNKTDEDLLTEAKNSLINKYNSNKKQTEQSFEDKINFLVEQQEQLKNSASEKENKINEYYNNISQETEDQALKRGLARSSIIINQLAGLNKNKATELINTMNELQSSLNNNYSEIENLNNEKIKALDNLDLQYAIDLEEKLNKVKDDYQKSVNEAVNFNNNVEKLQAEYKLDFDKQKLDKQERINKLEKTYHSDYIETITKDAQYNYLKEYFDSLDKDYALNLFLTNKELIDILGNNYSKMYKYLTNK